MECSKVHNDLIFFIEGNLDKKGSAEIEEHLAACQECLAFADMLRASLGVIEEEKNIPDDIGFADRIIAKVDFGERKQKTRTLSILRYVAAAAVIIFGVFTGMNIARLASGYQGDGTGEISEEVFYLNDMYQEPIESFFLLKYEDNE
jgi:anti-sigma factor RsiW